jgi:hypothetical protein
MPWMIKMINKDTRNIILATIIILFLIIFGSYKCAKHDNIVGINAKKDYMSYFGDNIIKLKAFVPRDEITKHSSGGFGFFGFIGGGSYSSSESVETKVIFYWKQPSGTYKCDKKDLSKFKIMINNEIKEPYLSFEFDKRERYSTYNDDPQDLYYVDYIVVHCADKHWQPKIRLPLQD